MILSGRMPRRSFTFGRVSKGGDAVKVSELNQCVIDAIDPQKRGRQYQARRVADLVDNRVAGFVLTRQKAAGRWGAATYALRTTDESSTIQNGGSARASADHDAAFLDRVKLLLASV